MANPNHLLVINNFGSWPAFAAGNPQPGDVLSAKLPLGIQVGDTFGRGSWTGPTAETRLRRFLQPTLEH